MAKCLDRGEEMCGRCENRRWERCLISDQFQDLPHRGRNRGRMPLCGRSSGPTGPGKSPGRPSARFRPRGRGVGPPRLRRGCTSRTRNRSIRAPVQDRPTGRRSHDRVSRARTGRPARAATGLPEAGSCHPFRLAPQGAAGPVIRGWRSSPTGWSPTAMAGTHDRRSCGPICTAGGGALVDRQVHTLVVSAPEVHHHRDVRMCAHAHHGHH
jgi:hypothetical protein